MPILSIDLQVATGAASAGSGGPAFAIASVIDADGKPLSLDEESFRFQLVDVFSGSTGQMTHLLNGDGHEGIHRFSLFPGTGTPEEHWSAGDAFANVRVEAPGGSGQAIGLFRIPTSGAGSA